ncbi:MAG: prepilin-type N-terminal cleavage/methylation domain-containing protein [Oceanospirillaceae bacterium]|nr:prepilin-type N-terminal cleavage/methylation domain-containing protein [Oceanospirillaceae bacterium]
MHLFRHRSLTIPHHQTGFTLLELVLSVGLAGLMMAAIIASLLQFNQHKLLAQTLLQTQAQSQLAVAQVLTDWFNVCGAGVISGTRGSISLMRNYKGRCIRYDYAHNAHSHNLTRKKLGGRNSGFIAQVESMNLSFGVDSDHDCLIDQWRSSYQHSDMLDLHQVKVDLHLMTASSRQLISGHENQWLWRQSGEFVIHPVSFIWRLPDVCS